MFTSVLALLAAERMVRHRAALMHWFGVGSKGRSNGWRWGAGEVEG